MSKTRKILATLTMVAVAATTSLTVVSSAKAFELGPIVAPVGTVRPEIGVVGAPLAPLRPEEDTRSSGRRDRGLRRGEAAALGLLGGVLIGSVIANANRQPVQSAPAATLPVDHYIYCDNRYRSYVAATNTFTGYDGRQHICYSPFVR